MTIRIAFPYKLRNGQNQCGVVIRPVSGRVLAWSSLKAKACTTENPRWRRVLVTKYIDIEFCDVWSTVITPLDPPY